MPTLQEQLDDVEAAIQTMVKTGAGMTSYTITTPGGSTRTVQRSLDQMRLWRAELRTEIAEANASSSGGGSVNFARRGIP